MAINYQYSRMLVKRSALTGVTPTINTGSTDFTDGTWVDTDTMEGEFFLNTADDLLWIRTSNGNMPINISGSSIESISSLAGGTDLYYDTTGTTAFFYSLSAGSNVTISQLGNVVSIASAAGGGSGGSVQGGTNTYTGGTYALTTVNVSGGTFNDVTITGNTTFEGATGSTILLNNSGTSVVSVTDESSNTIATGVSNSSIVAGSGNTISANLGNVFIAGVGITAASGDTAYFSKLNATTFLSGGTDLYDIFATSTSSTVTAGNYIGVSGTNVVSLTGVPTTLAFAVSDETTQITSGTSKLTYYMPHAMVLTAVRACLTTSGSTTTTVDINEAGASILSTLITIDGGQYTSYDSATPPVISDANLADNAKITIDIDGAGTSATGLKVTLIGYRQL